MKNDEIYVKAISCVESALSAQELNVVGVLGAIVHKSTETIEIGATTLAGNYCLLKLR